MCFIHRPEYYTKSAEDSEGTDIRGLAEFIIAKHRSGSTETVKLKFIAKYAKFDNWDDSLESPNAPTEQIYESRMNRENRDGIPTLPENVPPPSADDLTSMQNFDFQRDKSEEMPPF